MSTRARRAGCLSKVLTTLGLVLIALSAALLWLSRPLPPATVVPQVTAVGQADGAPSVELGPTAAAAATALLRPTAIPAAVPTASRDTAAARLAIPSLGIDTPVAEVGWHVTQSGDSVLGEWDTVAGAVGFLRGSADPGTVGNCVLAGHSANSAGSALSELYRIPIGDVLVLYNAAGSEYTYVVEEILTVDETGATVDEKRQHARLLDPTDQPVVTLVTCWPAWSYTSRIVVRGRLRGANQ